MQTYILKRLLLLLPMLVGITLISFMVMQLAPGAAGGGSLGEGGARSKGGITPQQREVMNRTFHLDKPIAMRYLYWLGISQPEPTAEESQAQEKAYSKIASQSVLASWWRRLQFWIGTKHGMLFGDFGYSMEIHSVTVWERLRGAIPITVLLNVLSFLVIYTIAIPIGIYSATHRDSALDHVSTVSMFMLYSMPTFWVAVLLIKLMVTLPPEWRLPFQGIQPAGGENLTTLHWIYESSKHLILPVAVMSYASLAGLSRFMRTSMIDVIRADFVRMARAKGLPEFFVIYKHALRNSLIPIITLFGGELPGLIGGSVIIESIFGVPGMGYVAYKALLARDYTVLMADITLVAVLVMIGFLISDLLYVLADPRISFDTAE